MNLPINHLAMQWFWVLTAIDGRAGLDRLLATLVSLGLDTRNGAGYVFCNRTGNRLRVLIVDASGVWLCHRRLHQGAFVRPKSGDTTETWDTRGFVGFILHQRAAKSDS